MSSSFCSRCNPLDPPPTHDDEARFNLSLPQLQHLINGPLITEHTDSFTHPSNGITTSTSEEINDLNDLISQLQTRRAILFRKTNTENSSIYKLPSELLTEIFQHVVALEESAPSSCAIPKYHPLAPIRLGSVSSHWRQAAWSSPQLWTLMHLAGCWAWSPKFPLAHILKIYFDNMKAMTLELSIDCFRGQFIKDDDPPNEGIPHEDVFNTIFIENAHKLKSLGFKMWPQIWFPRLEKVQQTTAFSNLEEFWINSPNAFFVGTLSLTNAPRLRKVELAGASISAIINFPFTQITHLTLTDIPSDTCLKLLTQCTNLEYFRCGDIGTLEPISSIVTDSVAFKNLNTFHYLDCGLSRSWREAMGRYLEFPSLQSVIWQPDWSGGVGRQMLRQHPETIQSLEFRFRRRDHPRLKHMLLPLISLSDLKISCWPSLKLSLLELLTVQENKKLQLLPSLRKLHLAARSNEMTPRVTQSLLAMIRSRRTQTEATLDHLILSYYVRPFRLEPWPLEFVSGVKEFVRDGMKLEILADNEQVGSYVLRDDANFPIPLSSSASSSSGFTDFSDSDIDFFDGVVYS